MPHDPYAPPAPVEDPKAGRYMLASRRRRLANYLIDQLCLYFLASLLVAIVAVYVERDPDSLLQNDLNAVTFVLSAFVLYYVSCESLAGRTLGKLITGTRTVTVSGGRPSFGQILLRTLVRIVPFEGLTFLTKDAVGFHDRWSGTRVVRILP